MYITKCKKGKNEFTGKADNGDVQHLGKLWGVNPNCLNVITFPVVALMEGREPSPISAERYLLTIPTDALPLSYTSMKLSFRQQDIS